MASNLKVAEIEGLSDDAVSCPHGITSAGTVTANNGIALTGNLAGGAINSVNSVTTTGAVTSASVTATGSITGGTITSNGALDSTGKITASAGIKVGSNEPTGNSIVIDDTLTVKSIASPGAAADALTVDQGNVKMGSSAVTIGSLIIGGTTYTSSDFSGFSSGGSGSGTNYVKGFAKIAYDFTGSATTAPYSGSYNVASVAQSVGSKTITVNWSNDISNPIVTFSSSQDGEDIADASKQLAWYVSAEAAGSITLTLRNGETNDSGDLYLNVVDA